MLCSLATIQYKLNFHIDVSDVHRQDMHQRSFQNFSNNKNPFISLINESLIHKAVNTFEKIPGHVLVLWPAFEIGDYIVQSLHRNLHGANMAAPSQRP